MLQSIFLLLFLIPAVSGGISTWKSQRNNGSIPIKLFTTATILVIVISLSFFLRAGGPHPGLFWGVFGAFSCSLFGDYFLSRGGATFLPGLLCYLAAHIGYLIAFLSIGALHLPALLLALVLISIFFLVFLKPQVKDRGILSALAGYIVFSVLVLAAAFGTVRGSGYPLFFGNQGIRGLSAYLFITGAILIVLSDAVIGYNKFVRSLPWAEFAILSSYYIAQISIGLGVVLYMPK